MPPPPETPQPRPATAPSASRSSAAWIVAWLVATACGFGTLAVHGAEGAPAPAAPGRLEEGLAAEAALSVDGTAQALVFLHPHCPCTLQTLAQLESAIARAPLARWTLFVVSPPGLPTSKVDAFVDGPAGRRAFALAQANSSVEARVDHGGRLADAFDARHSGAVIAYDTEGSLAFAGGIVASRSHGGPGRGLGALIAALSTATSSGPPVLQSVRGCPLVAEPSQS